MNKHTLELVNSKISPEKSDKYWPSFDALNRGYLSQKDVIRGIKNVFDLPELSMLDPVVSRAYNASKNKLKAFTKFGDDYVSKGEFAYFLQYLKKYANIWYVFDHMDTTRDHRISKNEFLKAVPLLREKGMKLGDPLTVFQEIDTCNGGTILFDEFCRYVIANNLEFIDL